MNRTRTFALVATSALLWLCCAGGARHYTPQTDEIARMPPDQAAARLVHLLVNAEGPVVYQVRKSTTRLVFDCGESYIEERSPYGDRADTVHHLTCPGNPVDIHLPDVVRIEVRQPGYLVTLRDTNGTRLFTTKQRTREDALALVDLLAWYRDAAVRTSSAPVPALVIELTRASSLLTDKASR